MDFSFFDAILDNIFVINEAGEVQYCNEPAAALCESSVRRIQNKPLNKFLIFPDLPWSNSGSTPEPMDLQEIQFKSIKGDNEGLSQVTVSKTDISGMLYYTIMVRNVTLEEVLHKKHQKQLVELENYSKNLEKMVAERTEQVRSANVMLSAIMDSLGQGFLVFDKNGRCADFYTKACQQVLGIIPKDKMIWDVLKLDEKDKETFELWIQAVFGNSLSFDSLKELAVQKVNPKPGQYVDLDYYKIDDENPESAKVVLVATDVTAEHIAKQNLEREKQFAKMIVKIVSNRSQFSKFLSYAKELIDAVDISAQTKKLDIKLAMRQLHTLEGEAALFSVTSLWEKSRHAQECIQQNTDHETISSWDNVQAAIKELSNAYDNYLTDQNELLKVMGIGKGETFEFTKDSIVGLLGYLKTKGLSPAEVQYVEDKLLSKPLQAMVSHYDEALTVISQKLNKAVNPIVWVGADIRIKPEAFSALLSSFIHVFRNAMDHGIEPLEDRVMMGKPEKATITFKSEIKTINNEKYLNIEISDDGQGIDVYKLRQRIKDSEGLSDTEIMQRIFDAGLSSRDQVSEFSGRGVGMNAVKEEVLLLDGDIVVESEMGKGTIIKINVPFSSDKQQSLAA